MKHPSRTKMLIVAAIVVFAISLTLVIVWIDTTPLSSATPPSSLRSVQEFTQWKGEEILGKGIFEDPATGQPYQVRLATAGRYFASGPSAYLFDSRGQFIEWTPDMGDIFTTVNKFDLSDGNLQRTDGQGTAKSLR